MLSIGLDAHERTSSVCILDASGRIVKEQRVNGHPRRVLEWLERIQEPFQICFEASTNYGWLCEELRRRAARVLVAHPGRLRLIFKSRRKNDRIDAARLAKLLYLDEVPTVHVPSEQMRSWRGLIEHRDRCVGERSRVKNALRALLRTHGIETVRRRRLWTKKGCAWMRELAFGTPVAAMRRDQFLDDLVYHDRKILRVERALQEIADRHPAVALLRSIPGVGVRTAEAFVAYVDDPDRFRAKGIGAYLGVVPRQDASASTNRLGRITREGPATVRKMLAEATWQAVRHSSKVRAHFDRICRDRADRRKKALIATAHYLARVMLAMLKTGELWREDTAGHKAAA
jgi:transposase